MLRYVSPDMNDFAHEVALEIRTRHQEIYMNGMFNAPIMRRVKGVHTEKYIQVLVMPQPRGLVAAGRARLVTPDVGIVYILLKQMSVEDHEKYLL